MRNLAEARKEFLKQAEEFDLGKQEEDFHAYLRHHNLEHYLSETQIADRNRDSNYLNGVGMTLGIGVPLTLATIYGMNKLVNPAILGHGGHGDFNYDALSDLYNSGSPMYNAQLLQEDMSLAGRNTRPMPQAPPNVNSDWTNRIRPIAQAIYNNPSILRNVAGRIIGERQPRPRSNVPRFDDVEYRENTGDDLLL